MQVRGTNGTDIKKAHCEYSGVQQTATSDRGIVGSECTKQYWRSYAMLQELIRDYDLQWRSGKLDKHG